MMRRRPAAAAREERTEKTVTGSIEPVRNPAFSVVRGAVEIIRKIGAQFGLSPSARAGWRLSDLSRSRWTSSSETNTPSFVTGSTY
ncbi:P27 family phage terminase small subunit [Glaciihabitans tibetensis]|uniref:P27 family phage terminase small subunit n=1 Tax=Glaciihabitans tibetensis TaxID=1266600 RepID=UPI003CCC0F6E